MVAVSLDEIVYLSNHDIIVGPEALMVPPMNLVEAIHKAEALIRDSTYQGAINGHGALAKVLKKSRMATDRI